MIVGYIDNKENTMKSTQITIKDNKEALARLSDFEKMGHELYHFNERLGISRPV